MQCLRIQFGKLDFNFLSNRFNAAEIGAMSSDIPYEAEILVKRMLKDPKVDVKNHWKASLSNLLYSRQLFSLYVFTSFSL